MGYGHSGVNGLDRCRERLPSVGYGHSDEMGFLVSKTRAKNVFSDVCMPSH